MRVDKPDIDVISTLRGEEVRMTVDQSALVHIMSILTDLYSDPEMAVIREYSTNAWDAHLEAGVSRPIEITTPTPLSPFLKIKDYGIGLSEDDIRDIYSKYGASTKRGSDTQVGMLGLGCKAALTYTQQFTLVAKKDGRQTSVCVSRDAEGAGGLTIVDKQPCDIHESGVEITIPAKRLNTIQNKAEKFFEYWPSGTVLLNGKANRCFDGMWITDNMCIVKRIDHYAGHTIVMGGVPYPVELDLEMDYQHCLVTFVEIGDVNFVPSREELQETTKTISTRNRINKQFRDNFHRAIQAEIDTAPTKPEALKAALEVMRILPGRTGSRSFYYRGTLIPSQIEQPHRETIFVVPYRSHKQSACKRATSLSAFSMPNTLWFYNYSMANFTAIKKRKLTRWLSDQGIDTQQFHEYALVANRFPLPWISDDQWLDWRDVEAVKLPRETTARFPDGRPRASYDVYRNSSTLEYGVTSDDIRTKHIFYVNQNAWRACTWTGVLLEERIDFTLVPLAANRTDKFKRLFPRAVKVDSYVELCYDTWIRSLKERDAYALQLQQRYGRTCRILDNFDAIKIRDPILRRAIRAATADVDGLKRRMQSFTRNPRCTSHRLGAIEEPLSRYPLVDDSYGVDHEHIYEYINLVYEAKYKGVKA